MREKRREEKREVQREGREDGGESVCVNLEHAHSRCFTHFHEVKY